VCVRLTACNTETSKRGVLSPSWGFYFLVHFYERTSLEVSYDPYLFYQIGTKAIKMTFSFGWPSDYGFFINFHVMDGIHYRDL
jgi:hypothetical protein